MADLSLDRIAALAGGIILAGDPASKFGSFAIDSREVRPGDLFFAIVAGRDGHDFVADAAARGARGAVVSRTVAALPPGFALVRADDTVRALQALARGVLEARAVKVVGVTGSVGKTTTKEFAAAFLASRFEVLKSEGNYNNHLGLALSLLRLEDRHNAVVLEMAMRAAGEIRTLAAVAPPDVAVITNVQPVHLEFLGNLDAVAAAKWEIVEGLKPGGTAVINGDDARLEARAAGWPGRVVRFGFGRNAGVTACRVRRLGLEGIAFDLSAEGLTEPCQLSFLTDGFLADVLAAAAAALALGVPLGMIAAEAGRLRPAAHRGPWRKLRDDIILIDDSYNSSPAALETALRDLAALPARRRVAVLGDMLELGPEEVHFHEEAGRRVAETGWDLLISIGPRALRLAEGARAAGMAARAVLSFASSAEAAEALPPLLRAGDLVLVKGSRGVRAEIVVERLVDEFKES